MKDLFNLKVASVESEFRVVLNAGAVDDVKVGMTFVIFELGDVIEDPDSGEPLGQLEKVKGKVEVVHVQEKLSVAQSSEFITRKVPISPSGAFGIRIHGEPQYEETRVRKKLSDPKRGDLARRIT